MKSNPTLGPEVEAWMLAHLVMGPGDLQGEPFQLDDDLRRFLWRAYELRWDPELETWRRAWNTACLSRPKGAAKSFLAAAIAAAELAGPVRFDVERDGHFYGRPVTSPGVVIAATELGQATVNTYDAACYMMSEGSAAREYKIDVGKTRCEMADGGFMRPVTARASSRDGGRESFVVFDETHLAYTPELRSMVATLRRNLTKRKIAEPWSMETTTAYRPGQGSIAEDTAALARAVAVGQVTDARLLYDHTEAQLDLMDLSDDGDLLRELRRAYGGRDWIDYGAIIRFLRDPNTDHADGTRYFLNRATTATDQWLSRVEWDLVRDTERNLESGAAVALGIDGSRTNDHTALVAAEIDSGKLWLLGHWAPPLDGGEWELPLDEVDAAVNDAFERYSVSRLYADPPYLQGLLVQWMERWGKKRVFSWPTDRDVPMAAALRRFRDAVRSGSDISHPDDPVLTDHILNARIYRKHARSLEDEERERVLIRKEHPKSKRKIDAAVAATLAFEARADTIAAGERPRGRRRAAAGF